MRSHQILTGACNPGDKTFAVGSVEGVRVIAYAAGCNIIILASTFQRVQIIPGICHNNVQITCIDVSNDTGKIAVAYENKVCVFEPTPLVTRDSKHGLDYWWVKTGELDLECRVASLAWNREGTRLLTAGEILQMWKFIDHSEQPNDAPHFQVGSDHSDGGTLNGASEAEDGATEHTGAWESIWRVRPPNPVVLLAFSSDGTLFATAGKSDRLVRIWYQNQQLLLPSQAASMDILGSGGLHSETYGFIYVAHPRPVTGFSWRTTSRFMPRCAVANILVTNCEDNISRLWAETVLPDDGLISLQQMDPEATQDPHFRAHRQKQRFIERLKHMRQSFATRKLLRESGSGQEKRTGKPGVPIPTLPSTFSVHDFHNFSVQGGCVSPGLHFHLAATINSVTDIPLVPAMNRSAESGGVVHKFYLHWLNNKEIYFSMEAEKILQELAKVAIKREDSGVERELLTETKETPKDRETIRRGMESSPMRAVMGRDCPTPQMDGNLSGSMSHAPSVTSFNTDISQPSTASGHSLTLSEALDQKIESLLQHWHQSPDLLFSVHPVDGSLLVWVADFLDEYKPSSFRQTQVSFSSRIPNAIPIGDACTMSTNVSVFNTKHILNMNEILKEFMEAHNEKKAKEAKADDEEEDEDEDEDADASAAKTSADRPGGKPKDKTLDPEDRERLAAMTKRYDVSHLVSMISKHENGTLNLWDVTFSPDSRFCQLLNISHRVRVNGHRFRVNDITPHPVLPLILTTSHHNMSRAPTGPRTEDNFCSELILWRVDAISPISKPGSGGIFELARINSRKISAFTNVAWIPTLLPSSVLGSISNSPSTCFVSSDGKSLRVYQAVIDARSLLAELNNSAHADKNAMFLSQMSLASQSPTRAADDKRGGGASSAISSLHSSIVSAQSSARPGVVIDLDEIADAQQDWQNTILLHTFHYDMIHGTCSSSNTSKGGAPANLNVSRQSAKLGLIPTSMSAMVDLRGRGSGFNEVFYVMLAERLNSGGDNGEAEAPTTLMHMWELELYSPDTNDAEANMNCRSQRSSRSATPENVNPNEKEESNINKLKVSSTKVCNQRLPLPEGVSVVQCVPAAGHISSSSIYPACLAPYLLITACSDNIIRFWTVASGSDMDESLDNANSGSKFSWVEWKMQADTGSSAIEVPGSLVSVSAAYTGRIAVAYRSSEAFSRKLPSSSGKIDHAHSYVNLFVAIYECESSGGIEWILEDKIVLKNVEVPRINPPVDQSVIESQERRNNAFARIHKNLYEGSKLQKDDGWKAKTATGLSKVPSNATLSKLKEGLGHCGEQPVNLVQKQLVQLDWVSNEDGSHILTVSVANKVMLLTTVSSELSESAKLASVDTQTKSTPRPLLRKSSSMSLQPVIDELKWMIFRKIELQTADGLSPLPMSLAWARDGVLVCAMDNEVSVYSQWKSDNDASKAAPKENEDQRRLKEEDLLSLAQESQTNPPRAGLKNQHGVDFAKSEEKARQMLDNNISDEDLLPNIGLFEASHLACPVLPQYHPKQLMELLHSGKIRWVKAILNHLVKCMAPSARSRSRSDTYGEGDKNRSRTLSISGMQLGITPSPSTENKRASTSMVPEEATLEYAEIQAVPPLPLWLLLEADKEKPFSVGTTENGKEYNELFSDTFETEEFELDFTLDEEDSRRAQRRSSIASGEKQGLSYFGPRQARMLSKLLTHSQLPGLTSLDQMHLMALADTVASCNVDIAERLAIDAAKSAMSKESMTGTPASGEISLESLDDCGLRFLLAMKHYCYLQRCLPLSQRSSKLVGLNTSSIIWGFHSESEDELVAMIPCVANGKPTWPKLRELGVAWWIRNNTTLRKLVEMLAKTAFQQSQEPLDAALYYLAMKKKSLVWGLYRSIRDDKMTQFFKNDFSEERWRKAALKNAFALLGKQRFEHAAAFFLLSGSLKDAMEIIISKLNDIQLAILVGRLYDGATESYPPCVQETLKYHILGIMSDGQEDLSQAHPDPFLRSIGHWILKDYETSLTTLLQRNVGHEHPSYAHNESITLGRKHSEADPLVFNFYVYLRTHPLILRQKASKKMDEKTKTLLLAGFKKGSFEKASPILEDAVTPLERKLFFSSASFHLRGGCPALALEVLSKLPANIITTSGNEERSKTSQPGQEDSKAALLETGRLDETSVDWNNLGRSSPTSSSALDKGSASTGGGGGTAADLSSGLDWGVTITDKFKEDEDDELKLEWSDDDDDEEDDDEDEAQGGNIDSYSGKRRSLNNNKLSPFYEDADTAGGGDEAKSIDIISQQMKFTACLKIMMEELRTLATGFEQDGGFIRYHLYVWLEREVEALKKLCNYNIADLNSQAGGEEADTMPMLSSGFEPLSAGMGGGSGSSPHSTASAGEVPSLHQVILSEKADFETRMQRLSRRKKWLLANQTLLRTLLSYCGLHGANGGGLVNVRMELILLLQELQQEHSHHQLLSPLPFPTTLPLLSACIAQQKTVIIDPVHYLQAFSHDILFQVFSHKPMPVPGSANYSNIFLIRDLSISLSSCIFQALCDSESMSKSKMHEVFTRGPGMESVNRMSLVMNDSSYLMYVPTANRRSSSLDVPDQATSIYTEPCKWPGVTSLRALLDRDKDDDTPNLTVLLSETYIAVYLSLLLYGLGTCDCSLLYRLVGQTCNKSYWSAMFGGGTKRQVRVETAAMSPMVKEAVAGSSQSSADADNNLLSSGINTVTNITKQRIKLNMKLLNVQIGTPQHDGNGGEGYAGTSASSAGGATERRQTCREEFASPECSIVAKLLSKPSNFGGQAQQSSAASTATAGGPSIRPIPNVTDYDSGDESELDDSLDDYDDDDDPFSTAPEKSENREHSDPDSYSWAIIRLAVLSIAQKHIESFLSIAGIELSELPLMSPLVYKCLRVTEKWSKAITERLMREGKPPDNFIPGCFADSNANGPLINKYKAMLEPHNTPYVAKGSGLGTIKRLWRFLIHQEGVQHIFIRYIFGKSKKINDYSYRGVGQSGGYAEDSDSRTGDEFNNDGEAAGQLRIIHKDQDNLTAFCSNRVSRGLVAVSNPREILEMNISLLLHPSSWSDRAEDEAENDILQMQEAKHGLGGIQGGGANGQPAHGHGDPFNFLSGFGSNSSLPTSSSSQHLSSQAVHSSTAHMSRTSHVVKTHKVDGVRRLCAHPHLPLYISGGQDGAVLLWEWSHTQQVSTIRQSGVYAKVNRIGFAEQGNKFGVCDGDGQLSLWQAAQIGQPFFQQQLHNKNCADFAFQGGSSSIVASAGHASDGHNVAIWDTLMPTKRSCAMSFICHDAGAACLVHATQHQLLITGGKKGMVCIWDLRQAKLLHSFRAHDHAVKCMSLDDGESLLATGHADGEVRVFDIGHHKLLHAFHGEHTRHGLFKNMSQGVSQVTLANSLLYSCGADGSFKLRKLPDREIALNNF